MGKRLRRERSVCTCSSISPHEDVWTAIARFLDGRSLLMLATTSKWFYHLVMDESIWKFACLRDLQVPEPKNTSFKWIQLYSSAFDGSHSYAFRQQEKHIDWLRIGAFSFDSPLALLTEKLATSVRIPKEENLDKMLDSHGSFVLKNIKTGIWIAGTMQILDARHIELFLNKGYQEVTWEYQVIGSHDIRKTIFDLTSWVGKPKDWQPKAMIAFHAVAVNTNLQKNDAGVDGEIVSIRISQQLL
ncbi:hypothetical protein CRG98_002988 [Punica granatum]|uniref:F-box domain-containing protein n=1 Tax=Punica granatum TaxID=22663 RepID=A0A2I0L7J0_PUNGR|nr:hypothetical protein CRG98_002988 [Punica granatum]